MKSAYVYREACSQPYKDCTFSSGFVEGHPVDTLYLELERDGEDEPWCLLLRPDEMAAIAWVAAAPPCGLIIWRI